MTPFLLALQFLTIIPLKIKDVKEDKLSKAMIYFPLAGLLLSLILVGINYLSLFLNFAQITSNIILVVSLIILTGGLHLDGLSDTADAIFSRKNKEEMLEIMRDSHIGVMGVLSLISILLLKIGFLSSISISAKTIALILMCVLSRWSLVFSMYLFPYARQEGKAGVFMRGINLKIFILASLFTLACVITAWKIKGLFIWGIVALSAYIIGKYINHQISKIILCPGIIKWSHSSSPADCRIYLVIG